MDVAWKLGVGSTASDWELRMSMRSFWKNYKGSGKFWIIGHIPSWINPEQVKCLVWPDPYRHCKDANLLHKALRLAMEPQISDPFIFCSDDQLLLRSSAPEDFKVWHCGEIPEGSAVGTDKWEQRLANTGVRLRRAGYPTMNFDAHVPCPLRKAWIKEALRFDFATKPGMCVHSTILNCSKELGMRLRDQSVRAWLGTKDMATDLVDAGLANNQFATLTTKSLDNGHIVSRIEELFHETAPWELDASTWTGLSDRIRCDGLSEQNCVAEAITIM